VRGCLLSCLLLLSPWATAAENPSGAGGIRAATSRWVDAFNRKDASAIVALYAPDAILFGTSSGVLRDSPALIADYFRTLPDLGDAVITVGVDRVQILGGTAIHSGYYTRSAAREGRVVQNPARFTFVYAWRDGQWRIMNHHSSALP
jgi:uncharacterized protein (TIGR02246 family)